ncbi:hypothetical protein ACCC96_27310 [Pseudomonas sp. Pseusp11]|uniref:hypothetical protein n=1 Tax=Pseudomonas sp. Pseusp11 TaxID=3243003 RepID=UPI0039B390AD
MSTTTPIGILAAPLSIDGVGADTVLPPDAHLNGVTLRIPPWPAPSVKPGNGDLLEIWILEPGATAETLFYSNRFPVPVMFPTSVPLPAQYLQLDGEIILTYRVTAEDTGNPDSSLPQHFIVRREIPVNLTEPRFPSATLWGYLNCSSQPKLWEAVLVRVPAQPGRFAENDECVLDWEGFTSLNGSGPIPNTALRLTKKLTRDEASSELGFDFKLESDKYEQYIKPMEKNASALARYTLYRNGIALGKSPQGLVKIDRGVPGESISCGPNWLGGLGSTVVDVLPFHRIESCKTSKPGACSLPSRGSPSGNNVDSSMTNSSMESTKMNMQVKMGGIFALPPTIVGQLADGRLTHKQLREDRLVKVQLADIDDKSPEGGARVELHLFPEGVVPVEFDPTYVVGTKLKINQAGGDWTYPIEFDVPVDKLIERFHASGDYTSYEWAFIVYDAFDNSDTSGPFAQSLVDLTAPYQRQPGGPNGTGPRPVLLTLGGTVPAVIDDAWLNDPANAGGLNLTIPTAYQKFEAGNDNCIFCISTQTTFPLMLAEPPAFNGPLSVGGVINITLAFLTALAEGTYFYSYNLTDLPGNISNNAAITTLFKRVKTPAPVLDVPRIPVTGTTGRIPITFSTVDPAPTRAIMEIDYPLNSLPGDRIIPYITSDSIVGGGPIALPEKAIPPAGTPGPLTFELDYATLADVFGDANSADEVEFEYWYELSRPTITPNPVSPSAFGICDFAYAGPEQPNLPELENPNIAPVVVQGAGTPAPAPNTLGPAQAGVAATMIWLIWTAINRPVTGREIVKFYYQGKQVGDPVPVRVGDTTVTTTLPWDTIRAEGNGTVAGGNPREAYLTIEYPGSANVMRQLITTKVDVTAIVINLPAPQIIVSAFRTTSASVPERVVTSINCPSLNHPVVANGPMPPYQTRNLRIRILRDANIPTGATVDLEFEGRVSNAVGAAPIPNTLITASATMPATGVLEFRLTDYAKIREIQLPSTIPGQRPVTRYARIAYRVNGIESQVTVAVALLNSSLVYCEQERPEPTP